MRPAPIVIVSGAATQHVDQVNRLFCQHFGEEYCRLSNPGGNGTPGPSAVRGGRGGQVFSFFLDQSNRAAYCDCN
jgi:hypothetical protein